MNAKTKLYIVPTPIGNLHDITFRAISVLKSVDLILCEDTRTSSKLLNHYEINTPLKSYHLHNEHKIVEPLVKDLINGKTMAVISDAGTPAISDPSFLLLRSAIDHNIDIECLPGATALIPAIVSSGLPCNEFIFYGFLPQKKGRKTKILEVSEQEKTVIIYESPHRIKSLIQSFSQLIPNRNACIVREISKIYEEKIRGTIIELSVILGERKLKGEIVLVIGKV